MEDYAETLDDRVFRVRMPWGDHEGSEGRAQQSPVTRFRNDPKPPSVEVQLKLIGTLIHTTRAFLVFLAFALHSEVG